MQLLREGACFHPEHAVCAGSVACQLIERNSHFSWCWLTEVQAVNQPDGGGCLALWFNVTIIGTNSGRLLRHPCLPIRPLLELHRSSDRLPRRAHCVRPANDAWGCENTKPRVRAQFRRTLWLSVCTAERIWCMNALGLVV